MADKVKCKLVWKAMADTEDRREALQNAEDIAKLTLPTLAPQGMKIKERPSTNVGTQAVRSLAASLTKAMMPPGAKSFRLDLPPAGWDWIRANGGDAKVLEIRARLDDREKAIHDALAMKTARSRFASALRRNLIEGTTVFVNRPDRIDMYPLRSHAVERESGMVRVLATEDEETPDPIDSNDEQSDSKDETVKTYTVVNFENGEVWQQVGNKEPRRIDPAATKRKRKGDDTNPPPTLDVRQFIVAVGEIPDVGDYPPGYAYNYMRQFALLDNVDASLNEAQSIASWNLLRLKPGSAVARDPVSLKKKRSGDPVVADKDDIEWLETKAKLADFAFIAQMRPIFVQEVAIAFAMGIKDRAITRDTTATEILEIRDELNLQTMDLLTSTEQTMWQPMLESEMYLQELASPLFPDLPSEVTEQIVKVIVVAGANALDKERQERGLILQVVPALMAMDPQFKINGEVAYKALTAGKSIGSLEGLVYRISDEQFAAMLAAQAGASGAKPAEGKRDQPIHTRGGVQPVQPQQPPKPALAA